MKTQTLAHEALAPVAVDVSPDTGIIGAARRLVAAVQAAAEARSMRADLAGLDSHLLRDIGIEDDEIARVQSRENFVPRNWHE